MAYTPVFVGRPRYMRVTPPEFPNPECDPYNHHLFFIPDNTEGREGREANRQREREARRVCASCPLAVRCADHALNNEEYGLWGGLSADDRAALGAVGKRTKGPSRTPLHVVKALARAGFDEERIKTIMRAARRAARREEARRRREDANERGAA